MNYEDFETELIRKQNLYIRKLEEQLAVYEEKDSLPCPIFPPREK